MEEKKNFTYIYSSEENNEIQQIRNKYEYAQNNSKTEQLRRLDRSVHSTAVAVSLTVGIIGLLFLGLGLCCVLVWSSGMFFSGVVIGAVGIIFLLFTYPIYQTVTAAKRKKIAPMIIKLADEIMKE